MSRALLGLIAVVVPCVGLSVAADSKNAMEDATIVQVDLTNHTMILAIKDEQGRDVEKSYSLQKVQLFEEPSGKPAMIDAFNSGAKVRIVERAGKLVEMHINKLPTP
jgi:hypothetical protein